MKDRKKYWIWSISAFALVGLALAGGGYWWFIRGVALTPTGEATDGIDPILNSPQVIRGEMLYQNNYAQCHGGRGEGNPNWLQRNPNGTLLPPPHDSTGHTWHHPDGQLYRIILIGGTIYETPGFKSSMPAFGDQLTPGEIRAVVTYFKSLWKPEQRASQGQISLRDPFP